MSFLLKASLFDPRLRELLSLVQVTEDEALTRKSPGMRSAGSPLTWQMGEPIATWSITLKVNLKINVRRRTLVEDGNAFSNAPALDTLAVRAALADRSGDLDRVLCLFTPSYVNICYNRTMINIGRRMEYREQPVRIMDLVKSVMLAWRKILLFALSSGCCCCRLLAFIGLSTHRRRNAGRRGLL